ncbi:MAG: hypothetical protein Q8L98_04605 [Chlamydiales bacterium]|nr:hypothetical protein [Chlamydiales bacterium]
MTVFFRCARTLGKECFKKMPSAEDAGSVAIYGLVGSGAIIGGHETYYIGRDGSSLLLRSMFIIVGSGVGALVSFVLVPLATLEKVSEVYQNRHKKVLS